jgi:hypothetical protein
MVFYNSAFSNTNMPVLRTSQVGAITYPVLTGNEFISLYMGLLTSAINHLVLQKGAIY